MGFYRAHRYRAKLAESGEDIVRCQQLRYLAFIEDRGLKRPPDTPRIDSDEFDGRCRHVLIEDAATGALVCCFRALVMEGGPSIAGSYAAKHYGLSRLADYPGRMIEIGRFCIHPAHRDPNIVRLAWATMSRIIDEEGVGLVFGCSSFQGAEVETHLDALALLKDRHLAPRRWLPLAKAPRVFPFARLLRLVRADERRAWRRMPPLLRSYLLMGGWVSDHAVIDE